MNDFIKNFSGKELVCALIAAAVLGAALMGLVSLWQMATEASNAEAYQRRSQLLNVILGMAGSVIGYYFGRVPAERLAQSAQAAATQAATQQGQAVQSYQSLRQRVEQVRDQIQGPTGGATASDIVKSLNDALR